MGNTFLWAFFYLLASPAFAADPPPLNQGAGSYVPGSAQSSPAVQQRLGPTNVGQIPTPDTAPSPGTTGIVAPSTTVLAVPSPGQYRNAIGEVRIEKMFLDRYKTSVVRVTSKDLAGNELSRAMGVGVGRNSQFIATPLSLILGNSQQWADRIEITHAAGNRYYAKVALIDEEKNLVLLAPEANPAPIPPAREQDERPNIDVFTISFESGAEGAIDPKILRGNIAAANPETGLFSVGGMKPNDTHAGTAVINTQGEMVGMLLPEARGVLSSTLQKLVVKAQKNTPIDPIMIGVILGRGVLVDPKTKGAFPTIAAALDAIKKGDAPKADTKLYTPARNRAVAPKESDKVVIKVMPGTYKEAKTISLPSNISLSGSGADSTVLVGGDPEKPVVLLQNSENTMVSGFRITPASLQKLKAPTVIISKGRSVTLLGNVVEAKGGVAVWVHESTMVNVAGNSFARGLARGLSCDRSQMVVEGNAFVGDWPMGISVDKGCNIEVKRNFFFENQTSIIVSSLASRVNLERNTFIRTPAAVKITGSPSNFRLNDNLFFECPFALMAGGDVDLKKIGRNAVWRSKMQARGRPMNSMDLVRTEPKFEAPGDYDFRLRPGQGQLGNATTEEGADLGAFQRSDYLGRYTQQLVRTLGVAIGENDLAETWGMEP